MSKHKHSSALGLKSLLLARLHNNNSFLELAKRKDERSPRALPGSVVICNARAFWLNKDFFISSFSNNSKANNEDFHSATLNKHASSSSYYYYYLTYSKYDDDALNNIM